MSGPRSLATASRICHSPCSAATASCWCAAKEPLGFAAGDHWSSSEPGDVLLGIVILRVTGVFDGDFLNDHVFRPLGMRTNRMISEADIIPSRAAGYHLVNDTFKKQDWV